MEWLAAIWALVVQYWPQITSLALPFVVALIARCDWSGDAKFAVMLSLCLVVGIVSAFVAGVPLQPETLSRFVTVAWAATFLVAETAYRVFRRYSLTRSWLDKLLALGGSRA